jgi:hypothetical protein
MNAARTPSGTAATTTKKSAVANISYVAGRIWTGGDLPIHLGEAAMLTELAAIQNAGITHILDNRIECSDESYVKAHAPQMDYFWNGQDDAGQVMPGEWFYDGVAFALEALSDPHTQVLAHCHMGINRGPSMTFAILLATGMKPVAALSAIRLARPIAAISYGEDALDWWHRMTATPASVAKRQRAEIATWYRRNPLDVVRIIRTMRSQEAHGTVMPD